MSGEAKVPGPPVALSTSSVYPERTPDAFEMAARLGYDGVEVMVYTDPVSQDADVLRRLRDYHQVPVLSVHAPSLLLTQRVWGREPWEKLRRAKELAERVGARVVVLHPPFRWQREYVRGFEKGLAAMAEETDVIFAVENMYPLRAGGSEVVPYAPHWDPTALDVPHITLDLSHTAASGSDALVMAAETGRQARPRAPGRRNGKSRRARAGRAPGARPREPALRRAARAAHLDRVPRRGGGRGEDQPGADQGGPGGGPGRVAGLRPQAPGLGGGLDGARVVSLPWQAVPRR